MPINRQHKTANMTIVYGKTLSSIDTTSDWTTWKKPKNCSFVYMLCLGGGAGGSGGYTDIAGTTRGGGAGGGAGGTGRLLIPAIFLPRVLYLLPGSGGTGGASMSAGVNAGKSYITDTPNTAGVAANTILVSGSVAATGGAAAVNTGNATAGTAETIATNILGAYQGLGLWTAVAGHLGALGSSASSFGVTFGGVGIPVSGGSGGGAVSSANSAFAGGASTGGGLMPSISGGPSGGATPGLPGPRFSEPWMSIGGSGGGGSTTVGSVGGPGGTGSGGGGGGAGTTGAKGGDGGPGMIVIISW